MKKNTWKWKDYKEIRACFKSLETASNEKIKIAIEDKKRQYTTALLWMSVDDHANNLHALGKMDQKKFNLICQIRAILAQGELS